MAPIDEMERRLNIWQALSEFFLDTELDETTYKYVVRAVTVSGYSRSEVKHILWQEVFPVLESNLRSVAGVWEGYPREWLKMNLQVSTNTYPPSSSPEIVTEINACWARLCELLPNEFA